MISPHDAKQMIRGKKTDVVLDVRTHAEVKRDGSYPNSVNIPMDRLEKEFPERYPDKATRVLVYCSTGRRARIAVETLKTMGYTNVVFISGTYTALT